MFVLDCGCACLHVCSCCFEFGFVHLVSFFASLNIGETGASRTPLAVKAI